MRVLLRILCMTVLLWNCLSLSVAQPVQPFVPQLPAVRPAPKFVSLNLVGALPKSSQQNAVSVTLDTAVTLAKSAPKLWLGISLKSGNERLAPDTRLRKLLATSKVEFVRIRADESADKLIKDADALFPGLKALSVGIILRVNAGSFPSKEMQTALKTLSAAKYGIVRWELDGNLRDHRETYAAFARLIRRIAPTAPIGFYAVDLNATPEMTQFLQMLVTQKIPCDSLAWADEANAAVVVRHIQSTRKILAKYPKLKGIILWLDLPYTVQDEIHSKVWDAVEPFVSGSIPNAVAGFTTGASALQPGMIETAKQERSLILRQRLSGMQLKSYSSSPVVKVAATREGKAISILIVGNTADIAPRPVTIRLKNLPDFPASGWRISRYDGLSTWIELATKQGKKQWTLRPVAVSDTAGAGELELKTTTVSDTPIVLEIRPHSLPNITAALSADRLLCRAGETITLNAYLSNLTSKAWSGKAELTGTLPDLITEGLRSVPVSRLTPDKPRLMRYKSKSPATAEDTEAFVNLAVNGMRSSLEFHILAPLKAAVMTSRLDLDAPGGTADVRLLLINRGASDLPLTIHSSAKIPLLLAQGKESVQTVPITIPDRDPGVYHTVLGINYGDKPLSIVTALIGVPYLCRYAALKPNIDGDLGEWTDTALMGMGRQEQIRGKAWRGPTDLSAYAYAKWDESFFYLACAVTDDFIVAPAPASLATKGDSVAFALTPDPILSNSEQGYGESDMEFCFALANDGQAMLMRTHGTNSHPAGRTDKAIVAIKRTGSRTFYEAAIPWQELGMTPPTDGRKFGFTIAVNDDDGGERGAIVWSDGFGSEKRPFLFPPLRLVR